MPPTRRSSSRNGSSRRSSTRNRNQESNLRTKMYTQLISSNKLTPFLKKLNEKQIDLLMSREAGSFELFNRSLMNSAQRVNAFGSSLRRENNTMSNFNRRVSDVHGVKIGNF